MGKELEQRTILITRSPHQSPEFRDLLQQRGARVLEVPTIEIRPRPAETLDPLARRIADWDWLIFTSANAARFFLDRCRATGSLALLEEGNGPRVCAVGPATRRAVESYGVSVDLVPESFQAEGVLAALASKQDLSGVPILLPIASQARDVLADGLRQQGADLAVAPVYDTVPPEDAGRLLRACLAEREPDLVALTSSSTARNFVAVCHPEIDPRRFRYAAIGAVTAGTCRELGIPAAVVAENSTVPGLVEAICRFFRV